MVAIDRPFLTPCPENLPAELRTGRRFVPWYGRQKTSGKWDKIPAKPDGSNASSTAPADWLTFTEAAAVLTQSWCDGISSIMHPQATLTGIDLDHCVESVDGELVIAEWARDIIAGLPHTYAELSPSGTGIRIFIAARKPEGVGSKRGPIECYGSGRHLTLTGRPIPGAAGFVAHGPEAAAALAAFCRTHLGAPAAEARPVTPAAPVSVDDGGLLDRARRATNGAKFAALYDRGDLAGYASASDADLALCSILRFWTGADARRMDTLFRRSALMRSKWDERHSGDGLTYGQMTITRALPGDVYRPVRQVAAITDIDGEAIEDDAPDLPAIDGDSVPWEVFEQLAAELRRAQDVVQVQQGIIANLRAENAELRERFAGIRAIAEAPAEQLRPSEKLVAVVLTAEVWSAEDREKPAPGFEAPKRDVHLPPIGRKAGVGRWPLKARIRPGTNRP